MRASKKRRPAGPAKPKRKLGQPIRAAAKVAKAVKKAGTSARKAGKAIVKIVKKAARVAPPDRIKQERPSVAAVGGTGGKSVKASSKKSAVGGRLAVAGTAAKSVPPVVQAGSPSRHRSGPDGETTSESQVGAAGVRAAPVAHSSARHPVRSVSRATDATAAFGGTAHAVGESLSGTEAQPIGLETTTGNSGARPPLPVPIASFTI